jgi:hypothetical protein
MRLATPKRPDDDRFAGVFDGGRRIPRNSAVFSGMRGRIPCISLRSAQTLALAAGRRFETAALEAFDPGPPARQ